MYRCFTAEYSADTWDLTAVLAMVAGLESRHDLGQGDGLIPPLLTCTMSVSLENGSRRIISLTNVRGY